MISIDKFNEFVDEAINALPSNIKKAIGNVAIVLELFPRQAALDEVEIKHGHVLLGLYQGIPQNVWGRRESGLLPDKITIFQTNIENLANGSKERLKQIIKDVVWHELGHHFGFNEEQVRLLEQKRRQKRQKGSQERP